MDRPTSQPPPHKHVLSPYGDSPSGEVLLMAQRMPSSPRRTRPTPPWQVVEVVWEAEDTAALERAWRLLAQWTRSAPVRERPCG